MSTDVFITPKRLSTKCRYLVYIMMNTRCLRICNSLGRVWLVNFIISKVKWFVLYEGTDAHLNDQNKNKCLKKWLVAFSKRASRGYNAWPTLLFPNRHVILYFKGTPSSDVQLGPLTKYCRIISQNKAWKSHDKGMGALQNSFKRKYP